MFYPWSLPKDMVVFSGGVIYQRRAGEDPSGIFGRGLKCPHGWSPDRCSSIMTGPQLFPTDEGAIPRFVTRHIVHHQQGSPEVLWLGFHVLPPGGTSMQMAEWQYSAEPYHLSGRATTIGGLPATIQASGHQITIMLVKDGTGILVGTDAGPSTAKQVMSSLRRLDIP